MISQRDSTMALRHILNPIEIGPVKVPNRVVRTGHGTGLGRGTLNETLIDYHVARAKGGVGLTILELLSVGTSAYPFFVAGAPGLVEGYRTLMQRVRPHGMRVFQQIGHLGNEVPELDGSPPWSSSDSIGAVVGIQAEPMSKQQIRTFVAGCVAAAEACAAGGLDGVELHMAHGYLLQQFLSPLYNHRDDEYGGSFEGRTRFALELATAVREALPANMALGVRLASEMLEGGMGPGDVSRVALLLQERGLIDYVNLTIGTDYNPHKIIGAMHEPTGYELPMSVPVNASVRLPVLVTGRFRTLEEADQVIRNGEADLVALTRAHIADPDIVSKTVAGRVESVRPCIGCNHGCIGGLLTLGRMGCAVNVAVGHEATLAEDLIEKSPSPQKVLVVGAGPAGLEAARIAALKGHEVILAEAASNVGGCINIAKRAPRRHGIGDIAEWLEREVYGLGVEVLLNTYVQADDVARIAPDTVIVATGSLPRMDGRQMYCPGYRTRGMDQSHVVSSHDLLTDVSGRSWGSHAVVYDDAGHYEGVAAAEFLIEHGVAVTFVTGHPSFAPNLEASLSVMPALERLSKGDFTLVTYAKLLAIEAGQVTVAHRYGGEPFEIAADTVVFISHNVTNRELLDELRDFSGTVTPVGDVRSPRYLQTAIREGHLAARAIA
jgi:2,4-dienoyl-CoA reductase-like NADH-dependent reductase (Old Yellow Enzyme family)/thioredoxin reductase